MTKPSPVSHCRCFCKVIPCAMEWSPPPPPRTFCKHLAQEKSRSSKKTISSGLTLCNQSYSWLFLCSSPSYCSGTQETEAEVHEEAESSERFTKRSHEIRSLWVEKSSQHITKIISRQPKSHQFKSCLRLEKLRALLINIEQPSQVCLELMEEMLLTETWWKYIHMPMCIYIVMHISQITHICIYNIYHYMYISWFTHRTTYSY